MSAMRWRHLQRALLEDPAELHQMPVMPAPRNLDHLVLPVADLDVAQRRFRALGFTVAPVGGHPFGTANCCVFLSDGTFLEPLAVAEQRETDIAVEQGNVFVSRDRDHRRLSGDNGFSAIVIASEDAEADHEAYLSAGMSAGPMLEFSRPFVDATGKTDGATFRLAFADDPASPEPYFFACQRVRSPRVDRSALQQHRNGVVRISTIHAEAADPDAHASFLEAFLGVDAVPKAGGIVLQFGQHSLHVEMPEPAGPLRPQGLRLTEISFAVEQLGTVRALLDADGVAYRAAGDALIVSPAPGQGATFIFEESA